jgi:hypothetical protein
MGVLAVTISGLMRGTNICHSGYFRLADGSRFFGLRAVMWVNRNRGREDVQRGRGFHPALVFESRTGRFAKNGRGRYATTGRLGDGWFG